ncbi:MAG: FAD-dependent oxidoreductase [Luminiphilus sp.]|jgi:NADH dehydrogenase FAD-containing subunit|nr:FAD-dependent oxidoreductase [Luminiphilus sp.]
MFGRTRKTQTVVIIGMGDTGVLVAARLSKHFRVIGIATKPNLVSGQELGKRLTDLSWWQHHYNMPLNRFKALNDVALVHGRAHSVDPPTKTVTVCAPDNSQQTLPYDYLVVASGTSNGFWRDDVVRSSTQISDLLTADAAQIESANTVAVIGGGPCGVSSALNIQRAYPKKRVSLYLSGTAPLPGYHEQARHYYENELVTVGVEVLKNHRAVITDVPARAGNVDFESGDTTSADAIIWTIGNRKPHTGFLPSDYLDEDGFVNTLPTLEVVGDDTMFAIGDVASTDPERSSARNWAYGILVHNLKRKATGKAADKIYSPPTHRWGSIVGPQYDGLTLHQETGKRMRLSRWLVDHVLLPAVVQRLIYKGIDRAQD